MTRRLPVLLLAALIATWAIFCVPGLALAAEPVFPTGSRIGLIPVGDLQPSTRFPGFEDIAHGVQISILELPPPAAEEIERSIFAQQQVGLTEVKRESFPFESGIGVLVTGLGEANSVKVRKWFLTASGLGNSPAILLKVEVPETAGAVYSEAAIREMLATVSLRAPPIEEQLAMLPFKIKDLAGFRVMKVVLNDGAILIDGAGDDLIKNPYAIISAGRGGPQNPDDRARFARELLTSAPLRDLVVTLAEPMRIDGRPGYEVRATATGFDGKPLALVQWLRFSGGGFLRIIGAVHKENWDQFFPRFRAVRDGISVE
jgi:hypothetical protein